MKKLAFLFLMLISFISLSSFTLPDDSNDYYIDNSETKFTLEIVNPNDTIIYNESLLYKVDDTFYIIEPTDTRIVIAKYNNINDILNDVVINIHYVTVDPNNLTLVKEDNLYYVSYDGHKLYGNFIYQVDDQKIEALDITTTSTNVSLIYGDKTITIAEDTPFNTNYIIVIVGLVFLVLIILYIIYLLIPKNNAKVFKKLVNKLIKRLNKNRNLDSTIFDIKLYLGNITQIFKRIDNKVLNYDEIKTNINELNLALENVIRLDNYDYLINLEELKEYFLTRLNNINSLITNKMNDKKDKLDLGKIPQEGRVMTSVEQDSLRYLEKIKVIKKDN